MKFFGRLLCVAVVCIVVLASCAKEQTESYNKYEKLALASWMRLNRPDLLENKQAEGEYYIDVLKVGEQSAAPVNDTICWVKFDFSGRDLNGNIILTRNEVDARLAGTFTKYTHYVPYYRYCGEINTSLLEGTHLAMRNTITLGEDYYNKYKDERGFTSREILLREGSEVVLYMPSSVVGDGVEGDGGYEGQYSLSSQRPFIVTMTIRDTVKNPLESEGSMVDDFCKEGGGLRIYDTKDNKRPESAEDKDHPYNIAEDWSNACDTVPQVYVDYRYTPGKALRFPEELRYKSVYEPYNAFDAMEMKIADALKERFNTDEYVGVKALGDSVKLDGKAKIWYIGRFLDGFIFDTNIDEVKKIIYGEVKTEGSVYEYTPESGKAVKAWYYTIPHLKFGQWAALITTSTNGYGASGVAGSTSTSGGTSNGYSNNYLDYMNYYNYANSYYGNSGYYGGYYNGYYGDYYGGYYGNYGYGSGSSDDDSSTQTTTVSTEIPPFTPLIFQIYVEPAEEE